MKALVIGNKGSIGSRHEKNLLSLGVEVLGCELGESPSYLVDFAIIASPTSTHPFWIKELDKRAVPFLCEKPVGGSSKALDELEDWDVIVPNMVACNLRFSQSMDFIRSFVDKGVVSFHARISDGNPLRSKYREGIALQDIHEFDYLTHLFGEIDEINLVPYEGGYDAMVRMKSGLQGTVHGDAISKTYHRELTLTSKKETVTVPILVDNSMYVKELEYFIRCLNEREVPMNSVKEAMALTRMLCEEYEFAQ